MIKNLISIIIPVFNRPFELKRALVSVSNSRFTNFEIIVIDDGSTKENAFSHQKICGQYENVLYIFQNNSGPGIARSRGLLMSKGEFIQYLDSDDLIHPEKLNKQIELMNSTNAGMVYCLSEDMNSGSLHKPKHIKENFEDLALQALWSRVWHTSSCLWRREITRPEYWTNLHNGEDVFHDVMSGLQDKIKVIIIKEVLCFVSMGNDNLSKSVSKSYMFSVRALPIRLYKKIRFSNRFELLRNPLSQMFFYHGLILKKHNYQIASLAFLKTALRFDSNISTKLYTLTSILLIRTGVFRNQDVKYIYRFFRRVFSRKIHQFRYLG